MDASGDSSNSGYNLRRRHSDAENDVKAKISKFDDTNAEISSELQSTSEFSMEVNTPSIQAEEIDEDILKYKQLVHQLENLLSEVPKQANEKNRKCVQKWNEGLIKLKQEVCDSNIIIGVFGKTRHGKSTLINALLEPVDVVPISYTQSCTAVVVQITKNTKSDEIEAEIEFLTSEEWDAELSILKADYDYEKDERFNKESLAGMAYLKLKAVYGDFERLEELSNEVAILSSLGKTETVTSDSSSDLQDKIDKYIRADFNAGNQYWPIVKAVTVRVPGNDTILNGCTLVDLPGYGDDNAARVKVAKDFLKNCSKILEVSAIDEALSNKNVEFDESLLTQAMKDSMESHLVFICTKNDTQVRPEVFLRELRSEEDINQLQQNVKAIDDLLKKETEKHKRDELKLQKEHLGINARAEWVKKSIKKKYQESIAKWKRKYTNMTEIDIPEPTVFCVSSQDYINIMRDDRKTTFSKEEETEIPDLKRYINDLAKNKKQTTKQKNIKKLHDFATDIDFYLSKDGNFENKDGGIEECVHNCTLGLMSDIKNIARTINQDIVKELSDIIANLEKGRKESEMETIKVCEDWSKYHRKTYFAAIRRGGIFLSKKHDINFNADLIKPFTDSMNGVWSEFFEKRLWLLIAKQNKTVENALKKRVDNLCQDLEKKEVSKKQLNDIEQHLYYSVDNELKEMKENLTIIVSKEKKEISRLCEPIIQDKMKNIYMRVQRIPRTRETNEVLTGLQSVMKTELEKIKEDMFQSVHDTVNEKLENLLLKECLTEIVKVWNTSLVHCFQYSFGQLTFSGQDLAKTKLSNGIAEIKLETSILCEKLNIGQSLSSGWEMQMITTEDEEIVEDSDDPCNLGKTHDNSELIRNSRLLVCASNSVGIIRGFRKQGTGFMIGSCYLATARHVILENVLKQGTDKREIDYDKITSDKLYVEFEYTSTDIKKGERYNFSKVSYESINLDFIIMEIKKDGRPLPPPLRISKVVTEYPAYLLGHPDGEPQKKDRIEYYDLDSTVLENSKELTHEYGDVYKGIHKKGTKLINTSFSYGASGAPVIMIDEYSKESEPAAVLMLIKGFPPYKKMRSLTEEVKNSLLNCEQCVMLYPLLENLKTQPEYEFLAKDITQIDLIRCRLQNV